MHFGKCIEICDDVDIKEPNNSDEVVIVLYPVARAIKDDVSIDERAIRR